MSTFAAERCHSIHSKDLRKETLRRDISKIGSEKSEPELDPFFSLRRETGMLPQMSEADGAPYSGVSLI